MGKREVIIKRRTFLAKKHPKGSELRKELNEDALTSEYMVSYRYILLIGGEDFDFFEVDLLGANFSGAFLDDADFGDAINQPIGSIDCIGTPNDATFTCTG